MRSINPLRTACIFSISVFFLLSTVSFSSVADDHGKPKAVLVTGSSSGLGLRMTQVLSENGFFVYAGVLNESDKAALKGMENVQTVRFDVTKQDQIDAAAKFIKEQGRGLYGLINNAGIADFGPVSEISVVELQRLFDVNVYGPYRVTQAFVDMIIESKGRIATTGSIAGIVTSEVFGMYSMSKHAVEAYTDALAAEMARFDVSVSVIEPGNYGSQIGNSALKRLNERGYWSEQTRFPAERAATFARLPKTELDPDPLAVAEAALDIMSSDTPKRRYMVVDQAVQADYTIRRMVSKTLELNQNQKHSFDRDALIDMLDQELEKMASTNKQ